MSGIRHSEEARRFEPTEHYRDLRDRCPVHFEADHEPPFFVVSRFDDVVGILKDPDQWRNGDGPGVFFQESGVLGTTDEPDHRRHRQVLRAAFVPTVINELEPRVRAIADELLDEFVDHGSCDFVEEFAAPLPALVIAELLGIAAADRHEFRRWSDHAVAALTGDDVARYREAKEILEGYVEAGVDEREARLPDGDVAGALIGDTIPDDVLSVLAVARHNGAISTDEARHLGYQLLVAGHETTTSLLGLMLYRLLERPDVMAALRADRTLLPAAIEEALRFDSPVHGLFRTNADECVLHGRTIPARSKVQVAFASANRDPAQFTEPDQFRIDRPRRELGRHVAFGWGIHFCIGAPLARLETKVAFEQILDRLKDIELTGRPERNDSFVLHGLTSLPIRFTSRRP